MSNGQTGRRTGDPHCFSGGMRIEGQVKNEGLQHEV